MGELYFVVHSLAASFIKFDPRMSMPGPNYVEERLPDGVRFVLPVRQFVAARRWGWAVCGVAAFGILFMAAWMAVPLAAGLGFVRAAPLVSLGALAFASLGLMGLLPMLKLFALGWAILRDATSTEVVLRHGSLICFERFWGLKYTRRCKTPIDKIQTFCVQPARLSSADNGLGSLESTLGPCTQMLVARWGTGREKQFTIAAVYPGETLQRFVQDLQTHARHVTITVPDAAVSDSESLLANGPLASSDHAVWEDYQNIKQPPCSDISVERRDDGITLSVPPAGLMRGSKGLFVFSIFWNGLIGFFVVFLSLAALGVMEAPQPAPWVGILFLLPFVAVGIGILLAAINMGVRTTAIATSGGQLFVARTGLFGTTTQRWCQNELLRVQVADSGMAVNDQPVQELQIHGSHGKVGILSERPEIELRWIAAELNQVLRVLDCT